MAAAAACHGHGAPPSTDGGAGAGAAFPRLLPELQGEGHGLLGRLRQPVGPAAPEAVPGPEGADAAHGQQLRQWVQVQAVVPERLLRRVHQGASGIHRRRQHSLLPVEQRALPWESRRDRHGAAGHGPRRAVHAAEQRVRARHGRRRPAGGPRDAVPPLVRPGRRLPPLRHPLEPRPDRLPRRRRPNPPLRLHRILPRPGDVGLRLHLGRLRLGHRRRPLQGRLPLSALPRRIPGLQDRRLRGRRAVHLPPRAGVALRNRPQLAAAGRHALGAAGPHHGLLLLQRSHQGPRAIPRVLARLLSLVVTVLKTATIQCVLLQAT